jgi:hypothetical protein
LGWVIPVGAITLADSDEVARAFRDDVAHRSDMMPPGWGASLADDFSHSILGWSIAGALGAGFGLSVPAAQLN